MKYTAVAAAGVALLFAASNAVIAAESDETFVKTAIGLNLAEIQMGQLAQKNGSSAAVRDFGAKLVKDHSANNDQAMALASSHKFTAPNAPSTEDQNLYKDLAGMTGTAFDKSFAEHMVDGHQKAIQLFTDQSGSATADIKSYVDKTLPALKDHLATAQKISSDLGATAMKQDKGATGTPATRTAADMQMVEPNKISANDVINTTVYDPDNRNIGEVHDVLMTKDGKIDAVVLDVGGFLGIGEKPVALAFEDLEFRRATNNKLYVYVKFTQQQLEQAPKYDKSLYEAQRDTMRLRSTGASQ